MFKFLIKLFLFICHFLLPSFVFESSSFYCTTGVNFLFLTSPIYMLTSKCREWKDEHDSNDEYNVDPSQFDDEDEYVDALRKLWKEKHDYFNEFS